MRTVPYIIGIRTETMQRINAVYCNIGIYLSVYLYLIIKLFVCVKGRTCLRIVTPPYCFNIFGSIFGFLFCLLIKKLILGCNTIWKRMRKFPCAVWNVSTVLYVDNEETFFYWKLHTSMVWIFQIITFSLDLKIEKQVWKFSPELLWEKRFCRLLCPSDIQALWLLLPSAICQKAYQHNYKVSSSHI